MHIGITGGSGFVGGALMKNLRDEKVTVFGRLCNPSKKELNVEHVEMELEDLSALNSDSFMGLDVIVHCAGLVHARSKASTDHFTRINVDATLQIARFAERAGVKRFIFISSVKAVSDSMNLGSAGLTEKVDLRPKDAFGRSKADAEKLLLETFESSSMDVVIIRSPLVYGPGVGANFKTMLGLAASGLPLPLGSFDNNRRSFIFLGNLIEFIKLCITREEASGQVFFVADSETVSTKQLFSTMRSLMGMKPRFIRIPVKWLKLLLNLVGRGRVVEQLNLSLFLDCRKAETILGWAPPITFEQGMRETVTAYLLNSKKVN